MRGEKDLYNGVTVEVVYQIAKKMEQRGGDIIEKICCNSGR